MRTPAAPATAVTVIDASWPTATVPSAHVTTPLDVVQFPALAIADVNVIPCGASSRTTTLVAIAGPALCTVIV